MIAFSRMISTGNICRSNPMLYQRFLSITGNNGNNDNSNSIFNIDNFAKFDMARESRCGFPEVIFASGKTNEHLIKICEKLYQQDKQFIATRVSSSQFEYIRSKLDIQNIEYVYDPITMILYSKIYQQPLIKGSVAVLCAGTSDFQVAEEAAKILELSGVSHISRVYDVGVAGIHRLFANYDKFKDCDVVICCAGMDGALPSVVGGIVKGRITFLYQIACTHFII